MKEMLERRLKIYESELKTKSQYFNKLMTELTRIQNELERTRSEIIALQSRIDELNKILKEVSRDGDNI